MSSKDHRAVPSYFLVIQAGPSGRPNYFVKWRHSPGDGTTRQMKRKIGPAWLEASGSGEWVKRRGRLAAGYFDERTATVAAADIVDRVEAELTAKAISVALADEAEVTFREVVAAFLIHREAVKGSRPSTLSDYRSMLAEPGVPLRRKYLRGENGDRVLNEDGSPVRAVTVGFIMRRLGDRPAGEVTTREIEQVLEDVASAGRSSTTVNKYRAVLSAIFNYAKRESTFALPSNPVEGADRRRRVNPKDIDFFSVEEIELNARALETGAHRGHQPANLAHDDIVARRSDDRQDGELVRLAGYTGLRRGELVALRWRDIDFAARKVNVRRTISAGTEVDAPKSGKHRSVAMSDRAMAALHRLSTRASFTASDDYVAVNGVGGRIDADALGKRVLDAQRAAGLRLLGLHGLRHSFASQLVAGGVGLASVQKALGHAQIQTTGRYLHAQRVDELVAAFSGAQRDRSALVAAPSRSASALPTP